MIPTLYHPSYGNINLGKVQNESYTKDSGVMVIPFPFEDDDSKAEAFGFQGAMGTITVTGVIAGTEEEISQAVNILRSIVDADPDASINERYYWTSTLFPDGISVVIQNLQIQYSTENQSFITYQIKMSPANNRW